MVASEHFSAGSIDNDEVNGAYGALLVEARKSVFLKRDIGSGLRDFFRESLFDSVNPDYGYFRYGNIASGNGDNLDGVAEIPMILGSGRVSGNLDVIDASLAFLVDLGIEGVSAVNIRKAGSSESVPVLRFGEDDYMIPTTGSKLVPKDDCLVLLDPKLTVYEVVGEYESDRLAKYLSKRS